MASTSIDAALAAARISWRSRDESAYVQLLDPPRSLGRHTDEPSAGSFSGGGENSMTCAERRSATESDTFTSDLLQFARQPKHAVGELASVCVLPVS